VRGLFFSFNEATGGTIANGGAIANTGIGSVLNIANSLFNVNFVTGAPQ
jgi:hypothetical protein